MTTPSPQHVQRDLVEAAAAAARLAHRIAGRDHASTIRPIAAAALLAAAAMAFDAAMAPRANH